MERAIGTVRGLHGMRKRWLFEGSRMTTYGLIDEGKASKWRDELVGAENWSICQGQDFGICDPPASTCCCTY